MDPRTDSWLNAELIVPDSPEASRLGFTSDKFDGCLTCKSTTIYIWLVHSKDPGKGHLTRLIQNILDAGYTLKVPTPIGRMKEIVLRRKFTLTTELDPQGETLEVWVKESSEAEKQVVNQ